MPAIQYAPPRELSQKRHFRHLRNFHHHATTISQGDEGNIEERETRAQARRQLAPTEILVPSGPTVMSRVGTSDRARSSLGDGTQIVGSRLNTSYSRAQIRSMGSLRSRSQNSDFTCFSAESALSEGPSSRLLKTPSTNAEQSCFRLKTPSTNVGQSLRWQARDVFNDEIGSPEFRDAPNSERSLSIDLCTTIYKQPQPEPLSRSSSASQDHWPSWYRSQLDHAERIEVCYHQPTSYDPLETRMRSRERTVSFERPVRECRVHSRNESELRFDPIPATGQTKIKHKTTATVGNGKVAWSEPATERLCPYGARLVFSRSP
jgi:hypothetical protein